MNPAILRNKCSITNLQEVPGIVKETSINNITIVELTKSLCPGTMKKGRPLVK